MRHAPGWIVKSPGWIVKRSWVAALCVALPAGVAQADPPAPPAPPPPPVPWTKDAPAEVTGGQTEGRMQCPAGKEIYVYRPNFVSTAELVAAFGVGGLLKIGCLQVRDMPRPSAPGAPPNSSGLLFLQGTPDEIETALDAIAYFDIPDPQVFVEAKIIEVTYDSNFEFGFSTLFDRDQAGPNTFFRGGSATLNPPSFFQSQLPGNLPFQGAGLSFGFVGKAAQEFGFMDLTLQAMQRDGTAEVLSKPSIVATERIKASVQTGQKTPVIGLTSAVQFAGQTTGQLTLTTSYVETKIGLDVIATHIGESFVTMDVHPTVSGVTGFSVGEGGTSAPIISDRTAHTTVTMADGDTLIIGGLYTNSTVSDKAKLPFLGDLPGIGKLFSRTKDQKVKTELVFFITPHILRKKTDFKVITPPGEAERLRNACDPVPGKPSAR
jgi:type II secretory pathway component GspD/PulD (secretin)